MPQVGPRPARSRWSALRRGAAPLVALAAVLAVAVSGSAPSSPVPGPLNAQLVSLVNPAPPASVALTVLDGRLTATWPASAEDNVRGYLVTATAGGTTTSFGERQSPYTLEGLTNGTSYRIDIKTVTYDRGLIGIGAQGPYTGSRAATDTATPLPLPPTALVAMPSDRQVTLSWSAPADNSVSSYQVYRGGSLVKTVSASSTSWTDTGLVNGTSYTWTVRAAYSSTNHVSADSGSATATPRDGVAPAAPTGLTAVRGDSSVILSWTANGEYDVATYIVLRDGNAVGSTPAGTRSYSDTGLVNDRAYSYTLKATDTSGNTSAVSNPAVSATPTDLTPPAVPTGLTATRGDGRVALAWAANSESDLASYRVLRDGAEVATVPAGTTAFTDTGLVNDRAYAYRLVAVDTHGNRSAASDPAVSATPTDLTPPAVPTGLAAAPGDGRVVLTWTANTESDLAGYDLFRDGTRVQGAVLGAGATSFTDTGLVNDRTYSYTLRARDGSGNASASSAPVSATPTDMTPPATPTGLAAVRGDGVVSLSWAPNSESDLAAYRLYRDGSLIATITRPTTTYSDTGLVNDRSYSYALVAVDTHGNASPASAPVSATPTDLTPPATPTGFTAARGDGQVHLAWTANTEADLAGYRVLRDGVVVATVTQPATSYSDTGLVNDRTYSYRLVAVDTHGNGSPATDPALSATPTDLTAPATPAGLAVAPGDGRAVLTWSANTEGDLASYEVYRDGTLVGTVTQPATSYTDAGLVNDRTYAYSLRAVDTHGNRSAPTATASATPTDTTAPATPTGLAAAPGDRRVALSWAANTEPDLAAYRIYRDGALLTTVNAPATSFTDSGLTNGQAHTYAIDAVDTHGNASARSATVTATPADTVAPATPAGLSAVPGDTRVTLTWAANTEPDLAAYRIYRDGALLTTVNAPATSFTDSGLTNGQAHTYAIAAVDTAGNASATSAPPVSATPVDRTPPAPPAGVTSAPGDGQVVISWAANTEADLAAYRVYRDGALLTTVTAPATGYTDSGLANGSAHTYEVSAVDTAGNESARSSGGSATPADTTAPAAPTSLTATPADGRVALSWTAPADGDVASYRVLRDGAEVGSVDAPATTFTDTGLANGAPHTYAVVAVDRAGNRSTASATATGTAADAVPPAAPTALTAVPGDARATLRWTAPADTDVASYLVLRADRSTAATVAAPATTAVVTGLANGTAVTFTVVAVDTSGNRSELSAAVTTTPVASGPPTGGSGQSGALAVSRDGRYVVIATTARLEPTDTNSAAELYRIDTTTTDAPARRISPLPAPASGSSDPTNASDAAISDDGNYVVLSTTAALVASDTNRLADVYRGDLRQTPTRWELVSVPKGGGVSASVAGTVLQTGASVYATSPSVAVSASGDRVLFYSPRNDLVTGDTNGAVDVFAKDMGTGAVTRVSTATGGGNLPRTATGPALAASASGRYVLFTATSSSGPLVVYRKDLDAGEKGTALVVSSVTSAGRTTEVGAYRDTGDVAVSDDGNRVVFVTAAKLLSSTPSASGSTGLAYVKDVAKDVVVALGNGQAGSWEHQVAIDGTGRYASFSTAAAQTPGDANGHTDVLRRDLATPSGGAPAAGDLVLVSANASGAAVTGPTGAVSPVEYGRVAMPADGTVVLVTVQPLVSGDTNGQRDLYRKDLATGVVTSVLTP